MEKDYSWEVNLLIQNSSAAHLAYVKPTYSVSMREYILTYIWLANQNNSELKQIASISVSATQRWLDIIKTKYTTTGLH